MCCLVAQSTFVDPVEKKRREEKKTLKPATFSLKKREEGIGDLRTFSLTTYGFLRANGKSARHDLCGAEEVGRYFAVLLCVGHVDDNVAKIDEMDQCRN